MQLCQLVTCCRMPTRDTPPMGAPRMMLRSIIADHRVDLGTALVWSPGEPAVQLQHAGAPGVCDSPEISIQDVLRERGQIRVIECVECVQTQLELELLYDAEVLAD